MEQIIPKWVSLIPCFGGYCQSINDPESALSIREGRETFTGVLDEVAIRDEALTAAQVRQVHEGGVTALSSPLPLTLEVEASGLDLVFGWQSQTGILYDLKRSSDLSTDPATWIIVQEGIEIDGPLGAVTIPKPADGALFYILEAYPAPPEQVD